MSKVTLNDIASGFASIAALNANFSAIEDGFENTLSRDGTTPNQMNADLDMNGYRILNSLATTGDGFTWEGAWATTTAYTVNQLVEQSGNTYICTVAHTSGVFATDLGNGNWELVASAGATGAGTGDMLVANNLSELSGTAATARGNIGAAASGANSDITSITGLTTPLAVDQGGTGLDVLPANAALISLGTTTVTGVLPGDSGNVLTSDGSVWSSEAPSISMSRAEASGLIGVASATLGVPANTKIIQLAIRSISLAGTDVPQIQLGTSAGIATSGYLGSVSNNSSASGFSSAFKLRNSSGAAAEVYQGVITFTNLDDNIWCVSGNVALSNAANCFSVAGSIDLGANALSSIKLMASGSDNFDGGSISATFVKTTL